MSTCDKARRRVRKRSRESFIRIDGKTTITRLLWLLVLPLLKPLRDKHTLNDKKKKPITTYYAFYKNLFSCILYIYSSVHIIIHNIRMDYYLTGILLYNACSQLGKFCFHAKESTRKRLRRTRVFSWRLTFFHSLPLHHHRVIPTAYQLYNL